MHDCRHVAAGAVQVRLDHLQDEGGGDGGVERVAAFFQNPHPDRGCDPMRRSDDPECALDLRTGGECVWIDIGHENAFVAFSHMAYRLVLLQVIKSRA